MKVIFLHGLGQTPSHWGETLAAMPDPVDAVCPPLRELLGEEAVYGGLYAAFSKLCGTYSAPVHLCGLSLGAVLALNYGLDHPERVGSLVLVGGQDRVPGGLLAVQNLLFHLLPPGLFAGTGFSKREVLRLSDSMRELDFRARLGEIACPALVLVGGRDGANKKAAVRLGAQIPGAAFSEVPGAGHAVNVEAPSALAEALCAFYRRVGRGGRPD